MVMGPGRALFETAIGACGIVWSDRGIAAVQLPEASEKATRARLEACSPESREMPAPEVVTAAISEIIALLEGEHRDLASITLDLDGVPTFDRRVYEVTRTILPGRTKTYGEVARELGDPGAARAVGQALGRNPFALVVPCHRVLAAGQRLGGFSASGGAQTKRRILAIEGGLPRTNETLPLFDRDA